MRLGGVPQIEVLVVMKDVKPPTVGSLARLQASKPFEKLEKAEHSGWLALLRKHLSETLSYTWLASLRSARQKLVRNTAPRCPLHSTSVIFILGIFNRMIADIRKAV